MRRVLLLGFLLSAVFCTQLNHMAGGSPVALEREGDFYVVATTGSVYVFEANGQLRNYLALDGVSDVAVDGGLLLVTLTSQDFPNVRAYSFPELQLQWDFEPTMEVFDQSLVWTEKQTRSWRVQPVPGGLGVASGYTFYLLSDSGRQLGNFTAGSDVWDFLEKGGEYWLATQEGAVYRLDADLRLLEKRQLCEPYELVEQVSNQSLADYGRSVWQLEWPLAACEDGTVHSLPDNTSARVKSYTDSQLYNLYYQSRRQTGYGGDMFRNVRLAGDGETTVAYTDGKLTAFRDGREAWGRELTTSALDVWGGRVYVLSVGRYSLETVGVYDAADGSLLEEWEVKGLSCKSGDRELLAGGKVLVAGYCEIKLLDGGEVEWYLPRSDAADYARGDGFRVFYTDNEPTQHSSAEFYSMFAADGPRVLWSYGLPEAMAREGHLSRLQVVGDKAVAVYSADGDDRLVSVDRGGSARVLNATDRTYSGALDQYLLNQSLVDFAENYSYSQLDMIPDEVKYGGDYSFSRWGDQLNVWLAILNRLPVSASAMDGLRHVLGNRENFRIDRRIRGVDTCDFDGDGVRDLLVSGEDYFVVRSGVDMGELFFKEPRDWRYENRINQPYRDNFTAAWYRGGNVICIDDASGDGWGEMLVADHEGNVTMMFGRPGDYSVQWQGTYKNLHSDGIKDVGDLDGDGVRDITLSAWVEDRPDNLFFVSSVDGRARFAVSPHQYSLRPGLGDVDGDGRAENLVAYDSEGAMVTVFSPTYRFDYEGLREFWQTWQGYGQVLPAEVVPDENGDGYSEIVMAASRRWGGSGLVLLFFDGQTEELLRKVSLEGQASAMNSDEWQLVQEVRRFGDSLAVAAPDSDDGQSTGKLVIYNLTSGNVDAQVRRDVKEVAGCCRSISFVTSDGGVFHLDGAGFPEPEVSVSGPGVRVDANPAYYTTIYVDGSLAAAGRGGPFRMRLSNGKHRLAVSMASRGGLERVFTQEVSTFTSSDLSFLNKLVIGALLLYGLYKAVGRWR